MLNKFLNTADAVLSVTVTAVLIPIFAVAWLVVYAFDTFSIYLRHRRRRIALEREFAALEARRKWVEVTPFANSRLG